MTVDTMSRGAVDTAANTAVQRILDRLVEEGREYGVQVAAYLGEKQIVDAWAGVTEKGGSRKVDGNTLFNAFSVAKALTATALHVQAERGLVDYDAPVARYWPEFAGDGREKITVRQVLTHRSGMFAMPADITVEQMNDWDWMIRYFERLKPMFEPGSRSGYQSMSFGWLVGEVVRRTDPGKRGFGQFVREEIALPLGAPDLWLGIPDSEQDRVAIMDDEHVTSAPEGSPYKISTPTQVDLLPDPFGRPDVRRACIPAVGSIFTARSTARLWAMLANGGQLDGVRLLSPERVATFIEPREGFHDIDLSFGREVLIGQGGYWLGGSGSAFAAGGQRVLAHPGMGGALGFADPDTGLSFAFVHNRLEPFGVEDTDARVMVVRALREAARVS